MPQPLSPLDGIRVVDLSHGPVGGLATMVMADFGAEVIKVEPPGGDPFRHLPSAPMWLRGKKSVVLDLATPDGRHRLAPLTSAADVVVASFAPGEAERVRADYETLSAANPGLVYTHITGFGANGPLAGYPAYEGVVAAKAGRMMTFEGTAPRSGPQYAALHVLTHATSQAASMGTMAALLARSRTGKGQYVETSLLQGMMAYDMSSLSMSSLVARDPDRWSSVQMPTGAGRMPTINYQPVMAKDGRWIQLGNLLQHLFDNFVTAADLGDIFADPRYQGSPASWAEADREAFRVRMFEQMRMKDAEEWHRIFVENGGVVSTIYQTTQDALADPDLVDNGHVVGASDGSKQIGPLARMTSTPADVSTVAPDIGEHQSLLDEPGPSPAVSPGIPITGGALEGITVLDFSTIIAAPLGCAHLADLGARVIKVEPIGGDPYRGMGAGGIGFTKTNGGKESISLDLKTPEGQEVIRRLIAQSDVVVHNFRPGVPARLGMSYEQAKDANPAIIYLSVNGYGPLGPSAHRPATHPIPGAALGGATWQSGGLPTGTSIDEIREGARRLSRSNEVNPDPNTSAVVANTVTIALYARANHGVGQEVFVDMMGANAYANWDDFFWYRDREPRPALDADLMGVAATDRLYRASDGWVYLGIHSDLEWGTFCRLAEAESISSDDWFSTRDGRREHADALIAALESLFATRSADDWESLLAAAGVGCVRADGPTPGAFWNTHEQVAANEMKTTVVHPRLGEMERHGPMARLHDTPNQLGPAPMGGQQTDAILQELGFAAAEIARFHADRIVWSEEGVPAAAR